MLDFFYYGISPWIKAAGYQWNASNEYSIARKFLRFSYDLHIANQRITTELNPPEPSHRNLPEDRDTFDMFLDTISFIELLDRWSFRDEIVGTRLEHMIREFCYIWIDVLSGKPGKWTQVTLGMNDDMGSEDDHDYTIPDANWKRRAHDLY